MTKSTQPTHLAEHLSMLADRFRWNVQNAFRPDSPLYAKLAEEAADDPDILQLAAAVPKGQPEIVLLLGVVHYLLLSGMKHALAGYYPSLSSTGESLPLDEAYPAFHDFCISNGAAIKPLLQTRKLQTNEVRRCGLLLPAFQVIGKRTNQSPLHLIEVGPSAGLNLLWDRYRYSYGSEIWLGDESSPVHIMCEVRGEGRPPSQLAVPSVKSRVGIDLMPANVTDDDQMRWQRALIWPDQPERAKLFEEAVQLARKDPPRLIMGDALALLPSIVGSLDDDAIPVVFHSFTLNQFPAEAREALHKLLIDFGKVNTLYRISIEWYSGDEFPALRLFTYQNGQSSEEHLGNCHYHGQWLEWLAASDES